MTVLSRQEILEALGELARELDRRHVIARIHVVGGAAIVLAYDLRPSTNDVDAAFDPSEEAREVAAQVGRRRGLGEAWLDDAAKIFIPVFGEPSWSPLIEVGAVEVAIADPRSLLAMKLMTSSGRQDGIDIRHLCHICGICSVPEAVRLYEDYFPEDPLPQRAIPLLEATFDQ